MEEKKIGKPVPKPLKDWDDDDDLEQAVETKRQVMKSAGFNKKPESQSEISQEIEGLAQTIIGLNGMLGKLASRLSPILRQDEDDDLEWDGDPVNITVTQSKTLIGRRIESSAKTLVATCNNVEHLIDRLGI